MSSKYRAVDKITLVKRLGRQCSPARDYSAYVIGPDVHGRICHCSSHRSMADARKYAEKFNNLNDEV